jgi:acetoin utilization deacetylase AcuC-like enzyme
VHKPDFLDYLETAYEEWIQEGGHENGVLPATIPHYKVTRLGKMKAKNILSKAGEYCFDLSAVITKGRTLTSVVIYLHLLSLQLVCSHSISSLLLLSADTFKAAWNSAQITLTATKELVQVASEYEKNLEAGTVTRENPPGLYALVRPPGHHAQSDLCGGYCFMNNVAIATQWVLDQPELKRKDGGPKKIAILDIDFHQ